MPIELLNKSSNALLDLIWPRSCHHCGKPAEAGHFLCWDCLADLTYVQPPFCSRCGDPVPGRIDHEYVCGFCSRQPPHFDLARSAVRYAGPVGWAIRSVKYHQAMWLLPDLTALLIACWDTHYDLLSFDALCYVPLHHVKQRERGFNQAEWLARNLSHEKQIPIIKQALRRVRDLGSQTHLTAAERSANVAGAFAVKVPRRLENKRLLLIDDVMTTGATVSECARVLMKAGAASVHVLTVARG